MTDFIDLRQILSDQHSSYIWEYKIFLHFNVKCLFGKMVQKKCIESSEYCLDFFRLFFVCIKCIYFLFMKLMHFEFLSYILQKKKKSQAFSKLKTRVWQLTSQTMKL